MITKLRSRSPFNATMPNLCLPALRSGYPADAGFSQTEVAQKVRIAIIGTPRSGNSWTRAVLRETLTLQEIAVHNPRDIPARLPERVILQLHWYREPNFQRFLAENEFRLLIIARHPLDVLVSAWHFAPYEPLTSRWLEGNTELSPDICSAPPASRIFRSYATSWGAENLLSVSYQWWHERSAIRLHYEDLVRDSVGCFSNLIQTLGGSLQQLPAALEKNRLAVFQEVANRHGWRGEPGVWRDVVTPSIAFSVWQRHRRVFQTLGYGIPVTTITRRRAIQNWKRLR